MGPSAARATDTCATGRGAGVPCPSRACPLARGLSVSTLEVPIVLCLSFFAVVTGAHFLFTLAFPAFRRLGVRHDNVHINWGGCLSLLRGKKRFNRTARVRRNVCVGGIDACGVVPLVPKPCVDYLFGLHKLLLLASAKFSLIHSLALLSLVLVFGSIFVPSVAFADDDGYTGSGGGSFGWVPNTNWSGFDIYIGSVYESIYGGGGAGGGHAFGEDGYYGSGGGTFSGNTSSGGGTDTSGARVVRLTGGRGNIRLSRLNDTEYAAGSTDVYVSVNDSSGLLDDWVYLTVGMYEIYGPSCTPVPYWPNVVVTLSNAPVNMVFMPLDVYPAGFTCATSDGSGFLWGRSNAVSYSDGALRITVDVASLCSGSTVTQVDAREYRDLNVYPERDYRNYGFYGATRVRLAGSEYTYPTTDTDYPDTGTYYEPDTDLPTVGTETTTTGDTTVITDVDLSPVTARQDISNAYLYGLLGDFGSLYEMIWSEFDEFEAEIYDLGDYLGRLMYLDVVMGMQSNDLLYQINEGIAGLDQDTDAIDLSGITSKLDDLITAVGAQSPFDDTALISAITGSGGSDLLGLFGRLDTILNWLDSYTGFDDSELITLVEDIYSTIYNFQDEDTNVTTIRGDVRGIYNEISQGIIHQLGDLTESDGEVLTVRGLLHWIHYYISDIDRVLNEWPDYPLPTEISLSAIEGYLSDTLNEIRNYTNDFVSYWGNIISKLDDAIDAIESLDFARRWPSGGTPERPTQTQLVQYVDWVEWDNAVETLMGKFPFVIINDIALIFAALTRPAVTPVFDLPMPNPSDWSSPYMVHVDLSDFDTMAAVMRVGIMLWVISRVSRRTLALFTRDEGAAA